MQHKTVPVRFAVYVIIIIIMPVLTAKGKIKTRLQRLLPACTTEAKRCHLKIFKFCVRVRFFISLIYLERGYKRLKVPNKKQMLTIVVISDG